MTMEGKAPALAMIWAMAENRVIGAEGGLPWRLGTFVWSAEPSHLAI